MNSTYQLSSFTGLAGVGLTRVTLVRDGVSESGTTVPISQTDALVQSGDYFVTLATKLDKLGLASTERETRMQLEDVVSDLLYLQDHYQITVKDEQ